MIWLNLYCKQHKMVTQIFLNPLQKQAKFCPLWQDLPSEWDTCYLCFCEHCSTDDSNPASAQKTTTQNILPNTKLE